MYTPPRWPYGWAPAKRWLVRCPAAQNGEPRRYNPLEDERALFPTFVDTPTTEEAILEFATQYGWLGVLTGVYPKEALSFSPIECLSEDLLGPNIIVAAESREMWRTSIEDMRFALTLWDAIRSDDVRQLRRFIVFQEGFNGKGGYIYKSREEVGDCSVRIGIIDDTGLRIPAEGSALKRDNNIVCLALRAVQQLVNEIWENSRR